MLVTSASSSKKYGLYPILGRGNWACSMPIDMPNANIVNFGLNP